MKILGYYRDCEKMSHAATMGYRVLRLARCPANLPSNAWYERKGFTLIDVEKTRSGRLLDVWKLPCN